MEQGARSIEHGAWEGRPLRKCPVGIFREGTDSAVGAWGKGHGARELRRSDIMIAVTMNSGNSEGVTL